jgi:N-carbamoyl-L-amino-acid hydrolase
VAYLELHIEQGPVLESLDLPLGVVLGTFGVELHRVTWTARRRTGSTPMDRRRDGGGGSRRHPPDRGRDRRRGGLHERQCRYRPGSSSVVETAEQPRPAAPRRRQAAAMLAEAKRAADGFAAEKHEVTWERIWGSS